MLTPMSMPKTGCAPEASSPLPKDQTKKKYMMHDGECFSTSRSLAPYVVSSRINKAIIKKGGLCRLPTQRKNHNHQLPYPSQNVKQRLENPEPISQNPHCQHQCFKGSHCGNESHLLNAPVSDPDFAIDPIDVLVERVQKLRLSFYFLIDLNAHLFLSPYNGGELVDCLVLGLHLLLL